MHILESIALRCNKIIKQQLYEKVSRQREVDYVGPAIACTIHTMLF